MAVAYQDWLEAQHGVLGSMLISPTLVPKVLSQMQPEDFSGPCVTVYQAIRAIFSSGQPVDAVTVRAMLGEDYTKFLMELMEVTPTAANYQAYVKIAKEQSRTVRLKDLGQQMADANDPETVQALLAKAVALNSATTVMQAISIHEAMGSWINNHFDGVKPEYLNWPIRELDDQLYCAGGDFIIIGGKPSSGKTAFALQAAWEFSGKKRVAFFSLETSVDKITDRYIALTASVPMENIKRNALNDNHLNAVVTFASHCKQDRVFDLVPASGATVQDIQAQSMAKQYDVIVIDYLQLLRGSGYNRVEQVTNISMDLHRFAQSTGITVIALSQLSRDAWPQQGRKADPDMSSLRESGQLEQDADVILMLYLEDAKQPNGPRVLRCVKNKEGERFRMLLDFEGKNQRFSKAKDPQRYHQEMARIARENKQRDQLTILPADTPVPFD